VSVFNKIIGFQCKASSDTGLFYATAVLTLPGNLHNENSLLSKTFSYDGFRDEEQELSSYSPC
jgi:hypothetical protein